MNSNSSANTKTDSQRDDLCGQIFNYIYCVLHRSKIRHVFLLIVLSVLTFSEQLIARQNQDSLFLGLSQKCRLLVDQNINEASELSIRLVDLAQSQEEKATSLSLIGDCIQKTSQIDSSISYFERALSLLDSTENISLKAEILLKLGKTWNMAGNTGIGIPMIFEAMDLLKTIEEREQQLLAQIILAEGQRIGENFDKAFDLLDDIIDELDGTNSKTEAYWYNRRAAIFGHMAGGMEYTMDEKLAMLDSSMLLSQKSVEISAKINYRPLLASSYNELGFVCENTNRLDQALDFYQKATQVQKEIGYIIDYNTSMYNYSRLLSKLGREEESIRMLQEIADLSAKNGWEKALVDIYKSISHRHEKNGRFDEGLQFFKKASDLEKTLYRKQHSKQLSEIETQYDLKNKQDELIIERQNRALAELDSKNKSQKINGALAALLAVLVLLGFTGYHYKKTRSTNTELLESRNQVSSVNEQLKTTLSEREALLKEIHHRVKNNLQIIASLLYLQSYESEDEKIKKILSDGQGRVQSMALIHQKLYENEDIKNIPFEDYLSDLISEIRASFGDRSRQVKLDISAKNIFFDIDTAVPLGLIINELSTNTFKYAFPKNQRGMFAVKVTKDETRYCMIVQDDGVGIANNNTKEKSTSLGLNLIKMLCDQLEGEYSFDHNKGTRFELTFEP